MRPLAPAVIGSLICSLHKINFIEPTSIDLRGHVDRICIDYLLNDEVMAHKAYSKYLEKLGQAQENSCDKEIIFYLLFKLLSATNE